MKPVELQGPAAASVLVAAAALQRILAGFCSKALPAAGVPAAAVARAERTRLANTITLMGELYPHPEWVRFDLAGLAADTGIGIRPEWLPQLFERFYRVDPSCSRRADRSGPGRSIFKSIRKAQGGENEAEDAPGLDSAFRIRRPLAA